MQRLTGSATLAVREDRGTATGDVLALAVCAAEGDLGLSLCELGVALDVDLPTRKTRRETSVHALLADRKRELIVRDDDRRLLAVVVEVHLTDASRRKRLRDEARRLVVPRDDGDLLAAQLRDDHAHPRAARTDAR